MTVLVLGGTAEARALAAELDRLHVPVVSSLAGRVSRPRLPVGDVRVGGFGGPDALAAWLTDHEVGRVLDATHPFAERISASAAAACERARVPLLRLERPGWSPGPGDDWRWIDHLDDAPAALGSARRVLLTSGRQGLSVFTADAARFYLVRCVDPPAPEDLPPHAEVLLDRGPYTLEGERTLMEAHAIDALVTKDSGGPLTAAKLQAARERGIPVVVVRRPPRPGAETVATVDEALAWAVQPSG